MSHASMQSGIAPAAIITHSPLDALRARARREPGKSLGSLLHHMDVDLLNFAYRRLEQEELPQVSPESWRKYGERLHPRLVRLHGRLQRGLYRPPRSRGRVLALKGWGWKWAKPAFEDRLVQRAVLELLQAIHEPEFLEFSWGYRPGRSQYDALLAFAKGAEASRASWIVYVNTTHCFESLNPRWLVRCLEQRVSDPHLLRLLRQWSGVGLFGRGSLRIREGGAPESPLAALLINVYLHYVFDLWAARWRFRHSRAQTILVRHGGDLVAAFEREADAKLFIYDLRERLTGYAPGLKPGKVRLIEYDRAEWEKHAGEVASSGGWPQLREAATFRKGLALLQGRSTFRVHSPDRRVSAVLKKGVYSLLGVPLGVLPRREQ